MLHQNVSRSRKEFPLQFHKSLYNFRQKVKFEIKLKLRGKILTNIQLKRKKYSKIIKTKLSETIVKKT